MRLFQLGQLAHERVVLGGGDAGLIEDIVQALVMAQGVAQLLDFLFKKGTVAFFSHFFWRIRRQRADYSYNICPGVPVSSFQALPTTSPSAVITAMTYST